MSPHASCKRLSRDVLARTVGTPAATLLVVATLLLAAPTTTAQLVDLQPGPNFPTAAVAFGNAEYSEDVDVADVDNDGDVDAAVANGGNSFAGRENRIFINQGGAQAGAVGVFAEESSVRLSPIIVDASRDLEFVDLENDGDLDFLVANRGNTVNGGEVSRAWINQGGLQFGSVGFFVEGTDDFWGALISVPGTDEEGVVDGSGPWRGFSCDCDFGDLDDDGDLDLFYSTYGPNLSGGRDSRVFLNDGEGRFDELWPWIDAAADIQLHTLDVALADYDGDFDIDVFASSRETLPRLYRNNLDGQSAWSGDPFTDVTATSLPDIGSVGQVAFGYESEFADMDGDGDFDVWVNNYIANSEVVLRNDGGLLFTLVSWIRGDSGSLENEVDFFDYDGDGDLDVFASHVLGGNFLYQGGLAQGLDPDIDGMFHKNGTADLGSQATWSETPLNAPTPATLDGEAADLDGDGDHDLLLVNTFTAPNRRWDNVLGVPDTHAPLFLDWTDQLDKSDGSDTVIHTRLQDNAPFYLVDAYDVRLIYTLAGGDETCLLMRPQGGQQFRGVIPGELSGSFTYRIEATDDSGNTGVSATRSYVQTSTGSPTWVHLGCGTPGVAGVPYLEGTGDLTPGSLVGFNLTRAAPGTLTTLWLTVVSNPVPFKGGMLYAFPPVVTINLFTDAGGQIFFQLLWPDGIPSGFPFYWQYSIADDEALGNVAISNALLSTAP